jgi:hypothetical protein
MSSCACRRWGLGTTCEKQVDTESSRELEVKLKEMQAERDRQATFWTGGSNSACSFNVHVQTKPKEETKMSSVVNSNAQCNITTAPPQQLRFWN